MSNQFYEGGYNKRGGNKEGRGSGDAGKIFVGGLNRETSDDDLKNYFSNFGIVTECMVKRDPNTGSSRGFGFVTFAEPSSVDHVLAESSHVLQGKTIDPKRAKARSGNEECTKVFVGGLDPNLPESDIREYFGRFGKIESLELPFDREKNQRRGFCFVSFESADAVETLCSSAKHNIGDREVDVKKATPKGAQQSQSRGGGRGGPRGGGQGAGRGGAPDPYGGGGWNAPGGYPAPPQPYAGGYDYSAYYSQQGSYPGYGQQPQTGYADPYGQGYASGYDYSSWYGGANPGAAAAGQQQQPNGVGPYGRGQRAAGENRYQPY